jgi:serine/threonine protein kinase
MLIGTADFVSPEQARDPTLVDIRADIYSLGCTFYFLLAGTPPFTGASVMQKLLQHQEQPAPSIQEVRPDVPDPVNAILLKMMSKMPEERFQIPLLVGAALRHFCPNAIATPGSVIRPPSSGNLNGLAPPTSSALPMNPTGERDPNPPGNGTH